MRIRQIGVALVLGLLAVVRVADAQVTPAAGYTPSDDTQTIRVGALIFYDFTYTKSPKITDAAGNLVSANAFNVTRTYINVTGNISHRLAFRITPDITRESGTGSSLNGSLTFRLKYGYAQINLDDYTGQWKQTWVRLGIQQHPFIDAQEAVYRYRFQGTVFVERDGGIPSSDAGVTFHTNFPSNYGEIHAGFYNGEGYGKAETNDQKSFQLRATLRPMPGGSIAAKGLRVTSFFSRDHVVKDAERSKFIASVWYEHPRLNGGFDFISGKDQTLPTSTTLDSRGWSFWVTPFFKEKGNGFEALLRYDSYQPSRAATFDGSISTRNRTIAGVSYWFPHPGGTATAALLFDFEQVKFDHFAPSPATATQQRYTVHGLISF
jgi:hypothetical protein